MKRLALVIFILGSLWGYSAHIYFNGHEYSQTQPDVDVFIDEDIPGFTIGNALNGKLDSYDTQSAMSDHRDENITLLSMIGIYKCFRAQGFSEEDSFKKTLLEIAGPRVRKGGVV